MQLSQALSLSSITDNTIFLGYDPTTGRPIQILASEIKSYNPQLAGGNNNNNGYNFPSIIQTGLIGDFQFLETSGTTINNSAPSSNPIGNGVIQGSGYTRNDNSGLYLNNASTYISFANTFQLTDSSGDFYCEALINIDAYRSWARLFEFYVPGATPGTNEVFFCFSNGNNFPGGTSVNNVLEYPLNTNVLLGYGYQSSNNSWYVFINNMQTAISQNSAPAIASRSLWLGKSSYSGDPYLSGTYFRACVYNQFLNASQRANNLTAHKGFALANGIYF